jgi:hypothetical protein
MDDLSDFDIVSYNETKKNIFQTDSLNKSTQVNQVRNQIYLILHDNKCYGYTHNKQNAKKMITKIADDQVKSLRKNYPELKIYSEFDKNRNMYSIYSVNKMLVVSYDHLETVVKFTCVKYIKNLIINDKEKTNE